MNNINKIIEYIIPETLRLNNIYLPDESLKINYSAIFCQNDKEYDELNFEASLIGNAVEDTPTGPLYKLNESIKTPVGPLWLLKIRKPYITHLQRGDADYTLNDYQVFKEKYLQDQEHFKLIDRGNFEMIELKDPKFNVLCYFSNIPLTLQLGIE